MATDFIQLGDMVINLANVLKVRHFLGDRNAPSTDVVEVTYVGGLVDTFYNEEAEALRYWIRNQKVDPLLKRKPFSAAAG